MDLDPARRVTNVSTTHTDTHGLYRFSSLPPGQYRVMSSFEYQMPDSQTMRNAQAIELTISTRTDIGLDLDLYVIR
jgi:protocatechuate 3,4-dioxygenase beta subunit